MVRALRLSLFVLSVLLSVALHAVWSQITQGHPGLTLETVLFPILAYVILGAAFGLISAEKPWLWASGLLLGKIAYFAPTILKSMASGMSYYQTGGFLLGAIGIFFWIGQGFLWCFIPAFIGSLVAVLVRAKNKFKLGPV
jgi:hypothetical protein